MKRSAKQPFVLMLVLVPALGIWPERVAAVELPDDFVNETVVTGLNQPIGMVRLPDGRLLVAEQRTGAIRVVTAGADTASPPVFTVPSLNISGGERGLLGIAVDPGWPLRPYVYLLYTRTGNVMRLVRYSVWGGVNDPQSAGLHFESPLYLFDDLPDQDGTHNGGRLRFGPDGCLYASLGDDQAACAATDSTSRRGQLMRLEVRGLPAFGGGETVAPEDLAPGDNPFPYSGPHAGLVYAYGLRNPWSFHIDPKLGIVYLADVGEQFNEEINEVFPGDFLGWPWREGTRVRNWAACPEPGGSGANHFKGPIIEVPHPGTTAAIFMGLMYREQLGGNANWPLPYQGLYGALFYGDYYSGWLRMALRLGGVWGPAAPVPGQPNSTDWGTGFRTATDFMMDTDGSVLWLAQFNPSFTPGSGHISRIRYAAVAGVPRLGRGTSLLAAAPNPFSAGTEMSFTLAAAADVRLDVFDVGGRRVRTLDAGRAGAGTHRHAWDGRDDSGAALPAGVYHVRLRHGEAVESLRVLRLR